MTNAFDTDIRQLFASAATAGGKILAGVTPDQLGHTTPCAEMTVRQLMDHMVGAMRRVALLGRGQDVESDSPNRPLDEWVDAYHLAVDDATQAWADPARLGQTVVLPFAQLPGAAAVALYTSEITVHTWDLARATGQTFDSDPTVVAASLDAMKQMLPPGARPEAFPFGDQVAVSPDAPAIDQLVAWTGRCP